MANISSPLPYIKKRECGLIPDIKSSFFTNRLNAAKNLFRKDLVCHFGCVNAIDFSKNGELLISGGDDRRVMLWQFGKAIMDYGQPVALKSTHQSNIFCLGITSDNQKIYSGGNDDMVIVHDTESGSPLEILQHQRAVCALSVDPFNDHILATAGNDGRLLLFDTRQSVHETMVISRSRKAFHGVMFHPQQFGVLVSANARDGVALLDIRSPKLPLIRYNGSNSTSQNSMSVRFNSTGRHILALRRRQSPILYSIHSADPVAEFYHQDYYNSCTMKSCSFAGDQDQYVLSGSDDFNLYMWKIPALDDAKPIKDKGNYLLVDTPHIILYGHRSIVNQVRYNPHYCLIASSGVEKIIKVWSVLEYPQMRGTLLKEAQGSDNPREIYSHEDYVSLVHHSGQYITHNYAEQSTSEDPRMMAFFDSLVQRELECLADETDSLYGSSSGASMQHHDSGSDSSDNQLLVDHNVRWTLPPKRHSLVHRELECLADETDSLYGSSSGASMQHHDSDSDSSDNQLLVDHNVRWTLPPKRHSLVQRELECLADETDSLYGSSSGASMQHHDSDSDSSDNQLLVDHNVRWTLPPKRHSLVQRELECLADETDSLYGSSSGASMQHHDSDSDSSDNQLLVDHNVRWTLPPKRPTPTVSRSHRCPHRLARLVASRHGKNSRAQKRGTLRRSKQSRTSLSKASTSKCVSAVSSKGKRAASRRPRGPRRAAPRALPYNGHAHSRISAPSSERTDSDEPAHYMFRNSGRIIRPLRRRMNPTRTVNKRKSKVNSYRKVMNLRSNNGNTTTDDNGEMFDFSKEPGYEENLAQPSTSTGYRGQSASALFRIAEVDSDDDQSVSSRPISPRPNIPNNLVSIIPTPINGSRDSLGDSLRVDEQNPQPLPERRNPRRLRRNGRISIQRSDDSSESPAPKNETERPSTSTYNRTVERLMNETNESELESSCSTEGSSWPTPEVATPDSGVGTVAGSSTRNNRPVDDVSDDPEYQAIKFRQRVKKARRNYRNHMDSDSN